MTFALKDFDALKKHFNDTVTVLLKREGKDPEKGHSIKDLTKRKEETLFLNAVLTELEARIEENKPRNLKPYAEIFYGAQALIQHDIQDNRGYLESDGLLFNRLNDGMGITESDSPDTYQQARHYHVLNNFLNLIYKEGDSRNGLLVPNALDAVPLDKLTSLITKSHKLEEATQKKITEGYQTGGKTEGHANGFTITHDIPASAIASFTTFDALKKALDDLILEELADKNVAKIALLVNPVRVAQLQSLLAMANTLSASKIKASEKMGILGGMMLLVREQIGLEYGKTPFSNDDIPKNILNNGSVIHTGLTKILKAKEMSREDANALITSAKNFMTYMTIEHSESKSVIQESVRAKHMFSDIVGFHLVPVLDFMQKLVRCSNIDALNRCVTTYKKELEESAPKKPSTSYTSYLTSTIGGFLGKKESSKEEKKDDAVDKEVEAKDEAVTTVPTYV
ncbi:type IV secretion protein Dot [Legionella maioricensis]|uniref:Type IV secretion protein Dot n=1 Tax=Legionella maioricensis TaxID=2896528 RepID=A0A9X2ICU3_9GAMM|nr:type IV secretion protein Dot [Legionella maioricensis]MCL9685805.1 type IV secretion protein Dot [Legionella maioricensis]MCL9689229.1 type IV secretion protein Dot [Legionella maioricensis]